MLEAAFDEGRGFKRGTVRNAVADDVDELLTAEELTIDQRSRNELEERLFWLKVELNKTLSRRAAGDYGPDPQLATFPEWKGLEVAQRKSSASPAASVTALFDLLANERNYPLKTRYSWPRTLKKLTDHIGHDDATRITDTDIIGWKDALVASGLSPVTIKNDLTVAKTFFRWAAKNKRISSNPAAEVEYKVKRAPGTDKRPYSDEEAKLILTKARDETAPHRRWVAWIAAFTGARVDEICGAMVSDVREQDGVHCLRISPEDREAGGSVKNRGSVRTVPLHEALIAEGFLEYVGSLPKTGPLFPNVPPDLFGKRGGNGSKTLGRWVRKTVGITNPRIQPNHAWRHRFVDQCRRHGVPRDVRFAITGHVSGEEGDAYGNRGEPFPITVLAAAMAKLPSPV